MVFLCGESGMYIFHFNRTENNVVHDVHWKCAFIAQAVWSNGLWNGRREGDKGMVSKTKRRAIILHSKWRICPFCMRLCLSKHSINHLQFLAIHSIIECSMPWYDHDITGIVLYVLAWALEEKCTAIFQTRLSSCISIGNHSENGK